MFRQKKPLMIEQLEKKINSKIIKIEFREKNQLMRQNFLFGELHHYLKERERQDLNAMERKINESIISHYDHEIIKDDIDWQHDKKQFEEELNCLREQLASLCKEHEMEKQCMTKYE